jgi:predicted nucleic acid-binding Zn ribbon protein
MNAEANSRVGSDAGTSSCFVCRKTIPRDAAVCTECESVQFSHRWLAVARRVVAVSLLPAVAWALVTYYQRVQHDRETTQGAMIRITEEIQQVVGLASEFQTAFEELAINCPKEANASPETCLAEYTRRLVRLDDLVARLSWKAGLLPLESAAYDAYQDWKDSYWLAAPEKRGTEYGGVRVSLKNAFSAMKKDGTLTSCQQDFEASDCGERVRAILEPFKKKTLIMFCEFEVDLNESRLALFDSLASNTASRDLAAKMRRHVGRSWCGKFVHERRQRQESNSGASGGDRIGTKAGDGAGARDGIRAGVDGMCAGGGNGGVVGGSGAGR